MAYMENKTEAVNIQQPTLLESISSEFCNYINVQENSILRIETKLHLIANRSRPTNNEKENDSIAKDNPDMVEQLRQHIRRISKHNQLLEQIEKHLSEII